MIQHLQPILTDVTEDTGTTVIKDSHHILYLKRVLLAILLEKLIVHDVHIVAALLDPVQKLSLKGGLGLDQNQINSGKNGLSSRIFKHVCLLLTLN